VVLGFELDRGQIAECGVKALVIVDPLQELGDGSACIRQIAVLIAVEPLRICVFMKDSQAALSQGFPLRDMLIESAHGSKCLIARMTCTSKEVRVH
jgi:hypothetical protein